MNKAILVVRLTKDPESQTLTGSVEVCRFTLAVDRRFSNTQGQREADFISCVAWRKTAEFVGRHFTKGMRMGLEGSIQTRSYEAKDGTKRYVTEIIADNVEFVESKRADAPEARHAPAANSYYGFVEVDDDELPF